MAIQNRNLIRKCRQLQVEFNRDIRSIYEGKLNRRRLCVKWNDILENKNCDSLKRQLKSYCSQKIGI